jgi:hypothetical protein
MTTARVFGNCIGVVQGANWPRDRQNPGREKAHPSSLAAVGRALSQSRTGGPNSTVATPPSASTPAPSSGCAGPRRALCPGAFFAPPGACTRTGVHACTRPRPARSGPVFGFPLPNGSGKTTTARRRPPAPMVPVASVVSAPMVPVASVVSAPMVPVASVVSASVVPAPASVVPAPASVVPAPASVVPPGLGGPVVVEAARTAARGPAGSSCRARRGARGSSRRRVETGVVGRAVVRAAGAPSMAAGRERPGQAVGCTRLCADKYRWMAGTCRRGPLARRAEVGR